MEEVGGQQHSLSNLRGVTPRVPACPTFVTCPFVTAEYALPTRGWVELPVPAGYG